ncbi:putative membrane protein [Bacillus thermophilus]|uniref:Membrane protein n=1 Tax=Siminovitchia thermophila TaxID=1245522 RepID=A0ABS2R862_9BACI|nr:DUF4064 domain-containing protein [Siminovitchia thermophila]MBM7715565.1 putative membrane protein [Siminovitchia thermophila]ONK23335.1 hypothetical protein BLX87_12050 [Bacillus sp. VT-16-64]
MKRTGEVVLGVIGIILNALLSLIGGFFAWAATSDTTTEQMANDPTFSANPDDADAILGLMSTFGWAVVAAAILGFIFGIIAVVNISKNKSPKLAGWMFIVGAVLTGVVSVGFGFLPALLYLIAGIMSFVRKEPAEASF